MGGRGLRPIWFGNGQIRNEDFSQRNRGASGKITCGGLIFLSFFCRPVVAPVLASVTVPEIQAKKLHLAYIRFALTQGEGRRRMGPRIVMNTYLEVA